MILTLLFLFFVLIGIGCVLIYNQRDNRYADEDTWLLTGVVILIVAGLCLLFCIGQISTREIFIKSHIVKIEAIRETFKFARIDKNIHPLELVAIQQKVVDKNEWIANAKFWTEQPLTNWFWSKRTLEIKPIR